MRMLCNVQLSSSPRFKVHLASPPLRYDGFTVVGVSLCSVLAILL